MKFFFIYPNITGYAMVPVGSIYLYTLLRQSGHEVEFFDMTFYGISKEKNTLDNRGKVLNFHPIDLEPWGVTYNYKSKEEVFEIMGERLRQFRPDVIGITLTEDTNAFGFESMQAAKEYWPSALTLAGGVFCMTAPEYVLSQQSIDAVCIGEGEISLPMLMQRLQDGEEYRDVPGLWFKDEGGAIIQNDVAPPTDLNSLPIPDLSFVDDRHYYAAMAGNVYRMAFIEGQRGCPRRCTYCSNQVFLDTYKKYFGSYLRKKSPERLVEEAAELKNRYDLNFIRFLDDDFTLRSENELITLKKLYNEKVALPFWCQAEANNVTEIKARTLREMGCMAISMGIETGSRRILENIYKRKTSKSTTIEAFRLLHKYGIRTSGNILIGAPDEDRQDIFESIEMARECRASAYSVNFLVPYIGTTLRELCVEKGYIPRDYVHDSNKSWAPVISLPHIGSQELQGLLRTFNLYSTLPKSMYPLIKRCETLDDESAILHRELTGVFWDIVWARGIDQYLPGVDYTTRLEERIKVLENKS